MYSFMGQYLEFSNTRLALLPFLFQMIIKSLQLVMKQSLDSVCNNPIFHACCTKGWSLHMLIGCQLNAMKNAGRCEVSLAAVINYSCYPSDKANKFMYRRVKCCLSFISLQECKDFIFINFSSVLANCTSMTLADTAIFPRMKFHQNFVDVATEVLKCLTFK